MVLTQFHITIGFQKPATCRSVPLHPREGPCCFWEMTHIRCTPRTLHSSPSTGDSNDVSDLLQNSIASKRSRKKVFYSEVYPRCLQNKNVSGNLDKFHLYANTVQNPPKCHPKNHEFDRTHSTPFQPILSPCHDRSSRWWPQHCKPCCWSPGAVSRCHEAATLFRDELQASYMMTWSLWGGWGRRVYIACGKWPILLDLGLT